MAVMDFFGARRKMRRRRRRRRRSYEIGGRGVLGLKSLRRWG